MRLSLPLFARIGKWTKAYGNLPDEFIERVLNEGKRKRIPGQPQFHYPPQRERKPWFSVKHPWEAPRFMRYRKQYAPVKPTLDWSYFPGDIVQILDGKDKGKIGEVKAVFQERNWVIVQGLNLKLVFLKGDGKQADIHVEEEQPLIIDTEVSLIDPKTKQPTEIEWRYTEEGDKVRVSVATETIIPMPERALTTIDYIRPENYLERSKDTRLSDLKEATFKPTLKTFEMEIMEKMGIKEDRVPQKYYWY